MEPKICQCFDLFVECSFDLFEKSKHISTGTFLRNLLIIIYIISLILFYEKVTMMRRYHTYIACDEIEYMFRT